jgi:WD40 repeat protein
VVAELVMVEAPSLVYCLAYSNDGKLIASGQRGKPVSVWDANSRKRLREIGPDRTVKCLKFSPDDTRIATSGWTGQKDCIAIWDVRTGELVNEFGDRHGTGECLAFSPDGQRLASADGAYVRVWNVETGSAEVTVKGTCPVFLPDGRRIACGAWLTRNQWGVKLFDISSGDELAVMPGHSKTVKSIDLSHDGKRIVSTGFDRTIKVWKIETGEELVSASYKKAGNDFYVRFSPDDKLLVTLCGPEFTIWDADTGVERMTVAGKPRGFLLFAAEFSPDGRTIAVASSANVLLFWDVPSLQAQ